MTTTTLIPGLTITDDLFAAAEAGIATHAPDLAPLARETFTDPMRWGLVPDDRGDCYKAEFELLKTPERTLKVNLWFLPDLRGGDISKPHSHPWAFRAHVLLGGYQEDRYEPTQAGVMSDLDVGHMAGGVNDVPRHVYHEVTDIHEPGRTLTLMVCDRGVRGAWGYLDVTTGEHLPVAPDPDFGAKFAALNPHRRR
jgi:hypothetical protein